MTTKGQRPRPPLVDASGHRDSTEQRSAEAVAVWAVKTAIISDPLRSINADKRFYVPCRMCQHARESDWWPDVPVTDKVAWTAVTEAVKRTGITKRISLHTLRHSTIDSSLAAPQVVKQFLQLLAKPDGTHSDLQRSTCVRHVCKPLLDVLETTPRDTQSEVQ